VRWDKIAEAAQRDDEACATRDTATTGVFEKRYQIGGVVTLDQKVADVFDGMLTASRSSLIQGNDGTTWISSDAPKRPVLTITDQMLMGAVSYRGYKARADLANQTTMRFVDPGQSYQETDGPPLIRADLVTEDGGPLPITVDLPFTPSPSMAQRIAKADLLDARVERDETGASPQGGASWSGVLNLEALGVAEDDCVEIASTICPHWNGLYVVDSWSLALNLTGQSGVGVSLLGYNPANCNDWNAANDDQEFVQTNLDDVAA
jgi:hypothetical protein